MFRTAREDKDSGSPQKSRQYGFPEGGVRGSKCHWRDHEEEDWEKSTGLAN